MVDATGHTIPSNEGSKVPLSHLVAALPEIYQPILGHPELSASATRICEDRFSHIAQIYQMLEAKLKRPLRVLDLGCAQGFFSLNLAKLGATVHGVDLQACNIAVCQALAREHPELKVSFQKKLIEDVIIHLTHDQYDLVLGLSVFHHLVHISGLAFVQQLIAILAQATVAGIFELALSNEPTKRASAQPDNPRCILDHYAFVHERTQHTTHLPGSNRPLYIASNRYWFLGDQVGVFDKWKKESHQLSKGSNGTRRYFFGNGLLTKLFTLDDAEFQDLNLQEHKNEITFLNNPPAGFKAARLLLHGQHHNEAWLVREQLPGELLLDKINAQQSYDVALIIQDILQQLVLLETAGLYHDDLRTWNILIGSDGHASLIDYGAITTEAKDRGWPYNIFLSFIIVLNEIISGTLAIPDPIRPTSFDPEVFPEPYRQLLWILFEHAPHEWNFALLHDSLIQIGLKNSSFHSSFQQSFTAIVQVMRDACQIHKNSALYWRRKAR